MSMELNCVSISLGSSKRDKAVCLNVGKYNINVLRIGVDGNILLAARLIQELQGQNVHSIGLGGIDLLLFIEDKYFVIKDAKKLYDISKVVPVVDGSITKRILEPRVLQKIIDKNLITNSEKVLIVSCLDRYASLKKLEENGFQVLVGDLVFALKINKIINNSQELIFYSSIFLDDVLNLPFSLIYPIGKDQDKEDKKIIQIMKKYDFDVIVGDFHYINKILSLLKNKVVITNTVTDRDIDNLRMVGISSLITTGILIDNRSFGANILDCIFAAFCFKVKGKKISPFDIDESLYDEFLNDFLGIGDFEGNKVV